MPFATCHRFAGIIAMAFALFGRLDTLAIDHCNTRLALATRCGPYRLSRLGPNAFTRICNQPARDSGMGSSRISSASSGNNPLAVLLLHLLDLVLSIEQS